MKAGLSRRGILSSIVLAAGLAWARAAGLPLLGSAPSIVEGGRAFTVVSTTAGHEWQVGDVISIGGFSDIDFAYGEISLITGGGSALLREQT